MTLLVTSEKSVEDVERKLSRAEIKLRILTDLISRGGTIEVLSLHQLKVELGLGEVSQTAFKRAFGSLLYKTHSVTTWWNVRWSRGGDLPEMRLMIRLVCVRTEPRPA